MYTCPMHPEVTSAEPGKCPKCGMALVLKSEVAVPAKAPAQWQKYTPLMVVIAMITVVAIITSSNGGGFVFSDFLLTFMTGFFLVFASFKLMDLKGFVEGYSTYDLLAKRLPAYAYAYPFIELAFGLLMLAGYHPDWLLWSEFIVMSFSGLGVAIKVSRGEKFQCACLGTFLKVPLTYVTLIEDFGMALLAIILIFVF